MSRTAIRRRSGLGSGRTSAGSLVFRSEELLYDEQSGGACVRQGLEFVARRQRMDDPTSFILTSTTMTTTTNCDCHEDNDYDGGYDWMALMIWGLHAIGGVGSVDDVFDEIHELFMSHAMQTPDEFADRMLDSLEHPAPVEHFPTDTDVLYRIGRWPHPDSFLKR